MYFCIVGAVYLSLANKDLNSIPRIIWIMDGTQFTLKTLVNYSGDYFIVSAVYLSMAKKDLNFILHIIWIMDSTQFTLKTLVNHS